AVPSALATVMSRGVSAAVGAMTKERPVTSVPRRLGTGAPVTVTPVPLTVTIDALVTCVRLVPVMVTAAVVARGPPKGWQLVREVWAPKTVTVMVSAAVWPLESVTRRVALWTPLETYWRTGVGPLT